MLRATFFAAMLGGLWSAALHAQGIQESRAHYLANSSVMIERGDIKILFDPLFRNDYGQYRLVPEEMEQALFAGTPPWDGIDAVFISHCHEDHFDPELMLLYLAAQPGIELYAPGQAVNDLRNVASPGDKALFTRVHRIALENGAPPTNFKTDGLLIEAVRVPHSGWPDRMTDIENIAFRVTLDDVSTITHLGDADPRDEHFATHAAYWQQRRSHLALPPFWFYLSPEGQKVLTERIHADHSVGVHVPTRMADDTEDRPLQFQGIDLFTRPGEIRVISTPE